MKAVFNCFLFPELRWDIRRRGCGNCEKAEAFFAEAFSNSGGNP